MLSLKYVLDEDTFEINAHCNLLQANIWIQYYLKSMYLEFRPRRLLP